MSDHKPSTPRDLYQEATDRIIKALESGFTPWQKPWEDVNTGPLRNGVSDRAYRGGVKLDSLARQQYGEEFHRPALGDIQAVPGQRLEGQKRCQV